MTSHTKFLIGPFMVRPVPGAALLLGLTGGAVFRLLFLNSNGDNLSSIHWICFHHALDAFHEAWQKLS
jgi:hypothetical protein